MSNLGDLRNVEIERNMLRSTLREVLARAEVAEAEVERLRAIIDQVNEYTDRRVLPARWSIAMDLRAITASMKLVARSQAPAEQESYPDAEGLAALRANEAADDE